MTRFPTIRGCALCHGDLLLQSAPILQDTVIHALRDVIKHTPDLLSVRWKRNGPSPTARRAAKAKDPYRPVGVEDGTANPASHRQRVDG